MEDERHHTAEQFFIEEAGIVLEHIGLPRMAGRVLGWLLICEPPYQSSGELATALHASKASISTTIRLLAQLGIVERMILPGKRRDYFRIREHAWAHIMEARAVMVTEMRALAERGLALRADADGEATRSLRDMHDFSTFYERELPASIARWRRAWQEQQEQEEQRR